MVSLYPSTIGFCARRRSIGRCGDFKIRRCPKICLEKKKRAQDMPPARVLIQRYGHYSAVPKNKFLTVSSTQSWRNKPTGMVVGGVNVRQVGRQQSSCPMLSCHKTARARQSGPLYQCTITSVRNRRFAEKKLVGSSSVHGGPILTFWYIGFRMEKNRSTK